MLKFFSFKTRISRDEYTYSYILTFILYMLTSFFSNDWYINGITTFLKGLPILIPIQATILYLYEDNIGLLACRFILFLFISIQFMKRLNDLGYKGYERRRFFYPFYFSTLLVLELLQKIEGKSELEGTKNSEEVNLAIQNQKEYIDKINEKVKKTLVYVGIFSVIMLFAGFTSAYIVLMGDSFWLKYPMPMFFWYSTATVGISSLTFIFAIRAAKQNKQLLLKSFMGITTLLGALFIFFQFKGYGELIDKGFYAANNHIMVVDGKYGTYFEVLMNGKKVDVFCNDYLLDGKKMSDSEMISLQDFTAQFLDYEQGKVMKLSQPNPSIVLLMDKRPVIITNGNLCHPDGKQFTHLDALRLKYLAENIRDNRGDFYAKGEIGKDFNIYYKGEELGYGKDRKLTYQGKPLSAGLETKAIEAADSASSFLYIITFIHLLHILVAMIYLVKITINSFSGRFNSNNHLSLRTGAIFWHFLGLLWVYLLLFLIYIH